MSYICTQFQYDSRAAVSNYSESRETKDSWFGSDWEKWHDSTEVANYLNFPAINDSTPAWSPFKSRFSEKSSYMVNGMSFSRPGTRPASYSKSAYAKTGFLQAYSMYWVRMTSRLAWITTSTP